MSIIPRIDVDTASRDKLIAHINALEDVLSDLIPSKDDTSLLRSRIGATSTEGCILACLLTGRVLSRHQLRAASRVSGDAYETKSIDVHILRLRRKLERHGIGIVNDWGHGFYIEADDLQRLRSLLSERAPS